MRWLSSGRLPMLASIPRYRRISGKYMYLRAGAGVGNGIDHDVRRLRAARSVEICNRIIVVPALGCRELFSDLFGSKNMRG